MTSRGVEIPKSPKFKSQRELGRLEIFKARGMMPSCRRCRKECKVLRGSPGTVARFICFEIEEN